MNELKKVYFNVRFNSRERMWDTVKYAENVCEVLLPSKIKQRSSIQIYRSSSSFKSRLKYKLSKYLINKQSLDKEIAKKADLLYMWGAFPKNVKKPFIIELDNPYVMTYYHIQNFNSKKGKLKELLKQAYKIVCLSDACRNHFLELFGLEFTNKTFILYPYVKENFSNHKQKADGVINFVSIGLDYRVKGIIELLEAFTDLPNRNIRLTVITDIKIEGLQRYLNDKRITFLSPQKREVLFSEIYPKMDVIIHPSFHESFGVVLLEGLSFGLGIIAVNTYAVPELVINGYNGKILHHPILQPSILNGHKIINCVNIRLEDFKKRYLSSGEFYYGLYREIKESILEAIQDYRSWQKNSMEIFKQNFSPHIWFRNFKKIIQ